MFNQFLICLFVTLQPSYVSQLPFKADIKPGATVFDMTSTGVAENGYFMGTLG